MKPRENESPPWVGEAGASSTASDAALDQRLERVTRFARRIFQVPVAWVSLLQGAELKVRQVQGLPGSVVGTTLPLDARCRAGGKAVAVRDLEAEPEYSPYRVALGPRGLRAYAACPVRAPSGQPVGVLNIADMAPRAWGQSDLLLLAELAALAETDVLVSALGESRLQLLATAEALRSCMLIDPLTQLWNRAATLELVEREHERARRYGEPIAIVMAGIDDFSTLRASEMGAAADLATLEIANRLRNVFRGSDVVGRLEEDRFLVFLGRCKFDAARDLVARVKLQFDGKPVRIGSNEIALRLSVSLIGTSDSRRWSPQDLVEAAAAELAKAQSTDTLKGVSLRAM